MLLLKFIRSLFKALNSDGTPGQVAAGIMLGAALGLTPLLNLHNLVLVAAIMLLNVSVPGAMLGMMAFAPIGFALDPLFNSMGSALLADTHILRPIWTFVMNTPVLALSNLNNTVVLGSLAFWVLASVPIFFLARSGIAKYRETIYERIKKSKIGTTLKSSKLFDVYKMFRPD